MFVRLNYSFGTLNYNILSLYLYDENLCICKFAEILSLQIANSQFEKSLGQKIVIRQIATFVEGPQI